MVEIISSKNLYILESLGVLVLNATNLFPIDTNSKVNLKVRLV